MEFNLLKSLSGLGTNWAMVIPGNFGGDYYTDLLFYDRATGAAQFYTSDGQGNLSPLRRYDNWSKTWTHIVPGNFSPSPYTDLMFYDATNGTAGILSLEGPGVVNVMQQFTGFSRTWSHIVPGNFVGNSYTDVVLYDQTNGATVTYTTDGTGRLFSAGVMQQRRTWTMIIPGNFSGSEYTDLLFFDKAIGQGQFYTSNGAGQFTLLKQHGGWRRTWGQIVPGNFGGNAYTDLLFYDPTTGLFEFYTTDGLGNYKLLRQVQGQRGTWSAILPGFFGGRAEGTSLFCFDGASGSADIYLTTPPAAPGMPWLTQWQVREQGRLSGDAAALWRAPNILELFGRGMDNTLYQNTWNGSWSGWRGTGDATLLGSAPVIASTGQDNLTLFATDSGFNVVQRNWTAAGGWTMWVPRGGRAIGEPSIVSRVPGSFDLFVRSTDNYLWQCSYVNGQWGGWQRIDSQFVLYGPPCAIALNQNLMFIIGIDVNGMSFCKTWLNGVWTNWDCLYGQIIGRASGVVMRGSTLHLFGRGRDNRLYRITYTLGSGWGRWTAITDPIRLGASPVALASPTDANRYDIFTTDTTQDGFLVQKSFSG